jgi:hypothetical protein
MLPAAGTYYGIDWTIQESNLKTRNCWRRSTVRFEVLIFYGNMDNLTVAVTIYCKIPTVYTCRAMKLDVLTYKYDRLTAQTPPLAHLLVLITVLHSGNIYKEYSKSWRSLRHRFFLRQLTTIVRTAIYCTTSRPL